MFCRDMKNQLAALYVQCTQQDVLMNNLLSRSRTAAHEAFIGHIFMRLVYADHPFCLTYVTGGQ